MARDETTSNRLGAWQLGSGAARGWSHIGVIEGLRDAGIEPDIVCGASMGAFVGAAFVAGQLDALRRRAESVTWREIVAMLDIRLARGRLIGGELIVAFMRKLGIDGAIEAYPKAFAAVATDLVTGREIWLRSGPIVDAVRSSISLPGILSPARMGDQWLVDGGLTNPVPVSVCRALGAEVVIAVNFNGDLLARRFSAENIPQAIAPRSVPGELAARMSKQFPAGLRDNAARFAGKLMPRGPTLPGYFDVLMNSVNIMQDHITRARLAGEPPHVMLVPRLGQISVMEFNRAKEAIAEGRSCVEQALPTLKRHI